MNFPKPNERTAATHHAKSAERHPEMNWYQQVVQAADELLADRPNLSRSTYRQRKAALLWEIDGYLLGEAADCYRPSIISARERLQAATGASCKRKGNKTSAKKARKVSNADFDAIKNYLVEQIPYADRAKDTLVAITLLNLTGMRPIELLDVDVESLPNGDIQLMIRSAKATNGRGLGGIRRIFLSNISEEERELILCWPEYIGRWRSWSEDTAIPRLKSYLRRVAERVLGPRRAYPCFYSFRHQAIADMKSAGLSPEEIAAVVGHSSSRTAITHYARRSSGRGVAKVTPDPSMVAKVRPTAKMYADRHDAPRIRF